MSARGPRAPRPAVASRPIPTLECFAAVLAAGAVGAGCKNPFDRTVPPPESTVRPDRQPAVGFASVFATGALMTTAPEHTPGAHPPRPNAHAAVATAAPGAANPLAAPATPGGCAVKEGSRYYYGGGGAMISVRPYGGRRYRRHYFAP